MKNKDMLITGETELAKITIDAESNSGAYAHGEVYTPWSIHERIEDPSYSIAPTMWDWNGKHVHVEGKIVKVEKVTLNEIINNTLEVECTEDISHIGATILEAAYLDIDYEHEEIKYPGYLQIEDFNEDINKLKLEAHNNLSHKLEEDLIINRVYVNGKEMNIKLPKGSTVYEDNSTNAYEVILKVK